MGETKFTVTIVAEFDELPDRDSIGEALDQLRGCGRIISAELVIPAAAVINVENWS